MFYNTPAKWELLLDFFSDLCYKYADEDKQKAKNLCRYERWR